MSGLYSVRDNRLLVGYIYSNKMVDICRLCRLFNVSERCVTKYSKEVSRLSNEESDRIHELVTMLMNELDYIDESIDVKCTYDEYIGYRDGVIASMCSNNVSDVVNEYRLLESKYDMLYNDYKDIKEKYKRM